MINVKNKLLKSKQSLNKHLKICSSTVYALFIVF